jgi:hypothetical protein
MINTIGHIRYRTHSVHISQDTETLKVHCFKYTLTNCDLESFEDYDLAADYICKPFDPWRYVVSFGECE